MAAEVKTRHAEGRAGHAAGRRPARDARAGAGEASPLAPAVIGRVVREAPAPGARVEGRVVVEGTTRAGARA